MPICDIIHGTPEPDFNTCVNDGHLLWASNENNSQAGQSSSNQEVSGINDWNISEERISYIKKLALCQKWFNISS